MCDKRLSNKSILSRVEIVTLATRRCPFLTMLAYSFSPCEVVVGDEVAFVSIYSLLYNAIQCNCDSVLFFLQSSEVLTKAPSIC